MGQSGADFSAVSTDDLVMRVLTRLTAEAENLPASSMSKKAKTRRLARIDAQIKTVVILHQQVILGRSPEDRFRTQLIQILTAGASSGNVRKTFRPRF